MRESLGTERDLEQSLKMGRTKSHPLGMLTRQKSGGHFWREEGLRWGDGVDLECLLGAAGSSREDSGMSDRLESSIPRGDHGRPPTCLPVLLWHQELGLIHGSVWRFHLGRTSARRL